MIVQVVYLQVKEEALSFFLQEATHNVTESKKETGVVQFDLLQQADAPAKFMLYEVYKDEQALEDHRNTSHFRRWLDFGVPLLVQRERVIYRLM